MGFSPRLLRDTPYCTGSQIRLERWKGWVARRGLGAGSQIRLERWKGGWWGRGLARLTLHARWERHSC
jgi:hypothetical protein